MARPPIIVGHNHVMVHKPKAAVPAVAKDGPTPPTAALAPAACTSSPVNPEPAPGPVPLASVPPSRRRPGRGMLVAP